MKKILSLVTSFVMASSLICVTPISFVQADSPSTYTRKVFQFEDETVGTAVTNANVIVEANGATVTVEKTPHEPTYVGLTTYTPGENKVLKITNSTAATVIPEVTFKGGVLPTDFAIEFKAFWTDFAGGTTTLKAINDNTTTQNIWNAVANSTYMFYPVRIGYVAGTKADLGGTYPGYLQTVQLRFVRSQGDPYIDVKIGGIYLRRILATDLDATAAKNPLLQNLFKDFDWSKETDFRFTLPVAANQTTYLDDFRIFPIDLTESTDRSYDFDDEDVGMSLSKPGIYENYLTTGNSTTKTYYSFETKVIADPINPASGNQVLKLARGSGSNQNTFDGSIKIPVNKPTKTLAIEYKIYCSYFSGTVINNFTGFLVDGRYDDSLIANASTAPITNATTKQVINIRANNTLNGAENKYLNGVAAAAGFFKANDWNDIKIVYDIKTKSYTHFVNGVFQGIYNSGNGYNTYGLADMLNDTSTNGMVTWILRPDTQYLRSGDYFALDDIKIAGDKDIKYDNLSYNMDDGITPNKSVHFGIQTSSIAGAATGVTNDGDIKVIKISNEAASGNQSQKIMLNFNKRYDDYSIKLKFKTNNVAKSLFKMQLSSSPLSANSMPYNATSQVVNQQILGTNATGGILPTSAGGSAPIGTLVADQWYNLKIDISKTGVIKYYLDNMTTPVQTFDSNSGTSYYKYDLTQFSDQYGMNLCIEPTIAATGSAPYPYLMFDDISVTGKNYDEAISLLDVTKAVVGSNGVVKATIANGGGTAREITSFVAAYNINNEIIDIYTQNLTVNAYSSQNIEFTSANFINATTIKTFVWNGNIDPYTNATAISN